MDLSILIDPDTGSEFKNVPVRVAAAFLDVAPNFIYEGLKKASLPIGAAVCSDKGKWTFNIPCERLKAYAFGYDTSALLTLWGSVGKEAG